MNEATAPGRLQHRATLGSTKPQRLLAEHVLSGCKGRKRDVHVCVLRAGDDDGIDTGVCHQRAPVGRGARQPELPRLARCTFRCRGADHFEAGAQRRVEDGGHGRHCDGMGLAHVAAADQPDPDLRHAAHPVICKRLQTQ